MFLLHFFLFQAAPIIQQGTTWSELNAAFTLIALCVTGLLTYVVLQVRIQIAQNMSLLRDEVARNYVPSEFDKERRTTITQQLDDISEELKMLRTRSHDLANQFTTLIMGKVERIELQINDKIRRLSHIETKVESIDALIHETKREELDLKRCVSNLESRLHQIELKLK